MNENMLLYLMMGVGALFLVIIVAYLIIKNRNSIKKKGFEYFVHVLIAFLFTF